MRKLVVLFFLVFALLLVFSGAALAFPNMGPYSPQACDSCHGTGKMAGPLPEQLNAPAPPVSVPAPAPAPQPAPAPAPAQSAGDYKVYRAGVSFFGKEGEAIFVDDGGVVYVSLRSLASLYNTYAAFDAGNFKLETPDFSLSGTVGQNEAVVNGARVTVSNAPRIYEDRVFVCATSLLKALEAEAVLEVTRAEGLPSFSAPLAPAPQSGYKIYRVPVSFFGNKGNVIIINDGGAIYVSLRSLADITGADVSFEAGSFELGASDLKLGGRVGEKAVRVNDQASTLDREVKIYEDRVFLDAVSLMRVLNAKAVLAVK